MNNNKLFLYSSFIVLFLTTFSMVQGWVGIGYFLPRLVYFGFVLIAFPYLYKHKDFLFLSLYFFYILVTTPYMTIVGLSAVFMEFAVPMVMAHYIIDENRVELTMPMALFAIGMTLIIMILTILADSIEPGIVRQMVYFSAYDMEEEARVYAKMGVCSYSFALISMCLAPVFLYKARHEDKSIKRLFYIAFSLLTIYFVYITGVTTCLIICFLIVVTYLLNYKGHNVRSLMPSLAVAVVIIVVFGFTLIQVAAPLFAETTFEGHFASLGEFFGMDTGANADYDFEGRVDLYKYSIETFSENPLFGDGMGKTGGHNYFLDRLARMGILGTSLLFAVLYFRFKAAYKFIPVESRNVYALCVIAFLLLGFLKNLAGIDYWTYMFVYIPCILSFSGSIKKKVNQ